MVCAYPEALSKNSHLFIAPKYSPSVVRHPIRKLHLRKAERFSFCNIHTSARKYDAVLLEKRISQRLYHQKSLWRGNEWSLTVIQKISLCTYLYCDCWYSIILYSWNKNFYEFWGVLWLTTLHYNKLFTLL